MLCNTSERDFTFTRDIVVKRRDGGRMGCYVMEMKVTTDNMVAWSSESG